jgi:GTP cyclohydrolase I
MDQLKVQIYFGKLMEEGLGFDLSDPNLIDTPKRIAKMYCTEWFKGINSEFSDFKSFPNSEHYKQIICFDKIHFSSICSHHFLPFVGYAWLLYIPDAYLVGASKPSRLIAHYSSRPQLQENLTHQILNRFAEKIKPVGAMVVMRALHECMICRGAKQTNGAGMITDALYGCFFEPDVKAEGLELIKLSLSM